MKNNLEPEEITDYSKMCGNCKFYFPFTARNKRGIYGHCERFPEKIHYRHRNPKRKPRYLNEWDYNFVGSGKIACKEFVDLKLR